MCITKKALLVTLSISSYNPHKREKGKTEELAQQEGAALDSVSVTKRLIAKRVVEAHLKLEREARTVHYRFTLPWLDKGPRLLPATLYTEYAAEMATLQAQFMAIVDEFVDGYQGHINEARVRLGNLFNEDDYLDEARVREKFSFTTRFDQISDLSDIRVEVDDLAAIQRDVKAKLDDASSEAVKAAYERVYEVMSALHGRLSAEKRKGGKSPIFRDSLVDNLTDLVDILPDLNFTDDPHLCKLHEQMVDMINVTPEQLRTSEAARLSTAKSAKSVMDNMAGYF